MSLTTQRELLASTLETGMPDHSVYPDPGTKFSAPCVRINAGAPWIAPSILRAGKRTTRWEVWAVAGKLDAEMSLEDLEAMVALATVALDNLAGWSAIQWDRPALVEMGGAIYLASRGQIETIAEVT